MFFQLSYNISSKLSELYQTRQHKSRSVLNSIHLSMSWYRMKTFLSHGEENLSSTPDLNLAEFKEQDKPLEGLIFKLKNNCKVNMQFSLPIKTDWITRNRQKYKLGKVLWLTRIIEKVSFQSPKKRPNSLELSALLRDIWLRESPEITQHISSITFKKPKYEGVTDMRGLLDSEEKRSICKLYRSNKTEHSFYETLSLIFRGVKVKP